MNLRTIIKILSITFITSMAGAQTIWNGTADTTWYTNDKEATEYVITTAEQLAGLRVLMINNDYWWNMNNKIIKLGADIILNDTTNWKEWENNAPKNSWRPIRLNGTFDGNGKVISGVYINSSDENQGLFRLAPGIGTVKNLGVIASFVKGDIYVGILGGSSISRIVNCYVEGKVIGRGAVGGLIGSNSNTIMNCYSKVEVYGISGSVGGLVGSNSSSGTITNSFASGNVLGIHWTGGLVGSNSDGSVINSYYNKEASEQNDEGKGEPRTTVEMKQKNTYINWDFNDIWAIDPTKNNGYPYLQIFENNGNTPILNIKTKNNNPIGFVGTKNGQISLNLKAGNYTVEFYNLQGRMINSVNINAIDGINSISLRNNNLSKGIFILNIKQTKASVFKQKIIIK